MKLIHLSDLHLGKKVNEFSMLKDQSHILDQILSIIDQEKPDGILIAGDVYDRTVPPVEAMEMFEQFLYSLAAGNHQVFIISGNHDSAERLAFGGRLMDASGIHLAPVYRGEALKYTLNDEQGPVNIYMLPFVKPATVRHALTPAKPPAAAPADLEISAAEAETETETGSERDQEIRTYTEAIRAAIEAMHVDTSERNVLISHQFVTGADTCESEEMSVGGLDNVDASVFDDFDYVALGHLHGPQTLGPKKNIRYCGTPLKYSFSEINHKKSVTIVELGAKADSSDTDQQSCSMEIRSAALVPLHEWVEVRETFDRATDREFLDQVDTNAYVRVTLLDEDDVPDAVARLRTHYPNLMNLRYDNRRTQAEAQAGDGPEEAKKTGMELFEELFEKMNNAEMTEEQRAFASDILSQLQETKA